MFNRLMSIGSDNQLRFRVTADFAIANICMLTVWLSVVLWRIAVSDLFGVHTMVGHFGGDYIIFFPFTVLLPLTFAMAGTYRKGFSPREHAARAAAASLFVGITYLVCEFVLRRTVSRGSWIALGFVGLVTLAAPGVRLLKEVFVSRYEVALRDQLNLPKQREIVLVVGGAGYIGSMLIRRLLARGIKVRVLDKFVYGPGAIRDLIGNERLEIIEGDCRNIKHVVQAVNGVSSIFHLAAIVGDPACELDRRTTLEINYAATRMLIDVAKGDGVRKFIFASSCSVYGATDEMVDETGSVQPISLYARTKVDSEQALLEAADLTFRPTILRLATVFGHSYRPRFDLVVNLLTAKAYQDKFITIFNGEQWRPFIHVADVADAMVLVLTTPKDLGGEILNVGDSRLNSTLSDIANKVQKFFPEAHIERLENSDRRNYRVSFKKIENMLGFRAQRSLEDGILEMQRHLEAGDIADYRDADYNNQKFLARAGIPGHAEQKDQFVMAAFAGGMSA